MKIKLIDDTQPVAIQVYTDGSCNPNPGPGGWAVVENRADASGDHFFTVLHGGADLTTNIKMEGEALIAAIGYAEGKPVEIYSDSLHWINIMTTYGPKWEKQGWRKNDGNPVLNLKMVQHLIALYRVGNVTLHHVRGHRGIPGNEWADKAADAARRKQMREAKEFMEARA